MGVIRAILNSGKTKTLEDVFGEVDVTSHEMKQAIQRWFGLYYTEKTEESGDECQRLPVQIVNKLYKTIFSEYTPTIAGGNQEFLQKHHNRLAAIRKKAVQHALIGGECFIKPVLSAGGFDFVVVRRDCFIPFARDVYGKITSIGTTETTTVGRHHYTLAERRTVDEKGDLTIESRLYRSETPEQLGTQVPLSALAIYANLEPKFVIPGIYNLGMVQMKTPQENMVDGSSDGVSVYAPAVDLIRNININERQLDTEFDNGESKVIASADMIQTDPKGRKRFSDSVFVAIDDSPENVGVTVYSPTLRHQSYLERKQEYLRNCESLIGLKRGILSEVEATERTAKAITSSEGDYNLTISDFQEMWELAAKEILCTCMRLGKAYNLVHNDAFDPDKDFSIDWGDGVLYNRDKVWNELVSMVHSGMLKPEIAVAWYFDMPYEDEKDLQKVRDKYMPLIEEIKGVE